MFGRFIAMFSVLLMAVATTVMPAHAACMSAGPGVDFHVSGMMHVSNESVHPGDHQQGCGASDAAMCDVICSGIIAILAFLGDGAGQEYALYRHFFPTEESYISCIPGPKDRPPKLCLL
jgi:hypothetical protein